MEKLSLDKFQDFEINDLQGAKFTGGSGGTCTCSTEGQWNSPDEQTDFYGDDGSYAGSVIVTNIGRGIKTVEIIAP
ncbi:hypothetical protein [Gaetbulibacter jejuensis]|uniref:Uncharacterized protein n=1 Tax=Gaetbulibacter jejuensis TaxID=584607 RepID=A0ABN1JMZ5_9FLAO